MRNVLGLTKQDPEYIEALTRLANLDLEDMRKRKAEDLSIPLNNLLSGDFSKPQGRLYYTKYLLKLYYYYYSKSVKGEDNRVDFLKWCFSKLGGDHTRTVIHFIMEHKATTFKEIVASTTVSEQMITYTLKEMMRWGLVESKAYVKSPYIKLKGRAPRIFSTIDATPENLVEAQRRYAIQSLGYDPSKLHDVVTAQNKINWTGDPMITIYNQYKDTNWTPAEIGASLRALGYSDNKLTTAMAKILGMLRERARKREEP